MLKVVSHTFFLRCVLLSTLSAFGGPEAHTTVFLRYFVEKYKIINEKILLEYIALCSLLPGPTSTQTIIALGYRQGGALLGFLTFLVWALPAISFMIALSLLYQSIQQYQQYQHIFVYLSFMAIGFVIYGSYQINKKVIKDKLTLFLVFFSAIVTFFIHNFWIIPLLFLMASVVCIRYYKVPSKTMVEISWKVIKWQYLWLFIGFYFLGQFIIQWHYSVWLDLFNQFYEYGFLAFGGGQVIVPLMYHELVDLKALINSEQFMVGYGLAQGIPGPMFSFSAYIGSLSMRESDLLTQIIVGMMSGVALFLPGILLLYFVLSLWEKIKMVAFINMALVGINTVVGGLMISVSFTLCFLFIRFDNGIMPMVIMLFTIIFLNFKSLSPFWIIILTMLLGFL